jgi:hypothetical protein
MRQSILIGKRFVRTVFSTLANPPAMRQSILIGKRFVRTVFSTLAKAACFYLWENLFFVLLLE